MPLLRPFFFIKIFSRDKLVKNEKYYWSLVQCACVCFDFLAWKSRFVFRRRKHYPSHLSRENAKEIFFLRLWLRWMGRAWVWKQDGATPHTALAKKESSWLCALEIPPQELSKIHWRSARGIDDSLTGIPLKTIRAAITAWLRHLRVVQDVEGGHFEHLLQWFSKHWRLFYWNILRIFF